MDLLFSGTRQRKIGVDFCSGKVVDRLTRSFQKMLVYKGKTNSWLSTVLTKCLLLNFFQV